MVAERPAGNANNARRDEAFVLGDVVVDPVRNGIGDLRVDAKTMDVLVTLVRAAPTIVSTDELLRQVWSGVVVVDNVVHQAISKLRRALQDSTRAPRYIELIRKRGYRLVASVQRIATLDAEHAAAVRASDPLAATVPPPDTTGLLDRVLRQRIARLPPDEQSLLRSVAMLDDAAGPAQLRALAGMDAEHVERARNALIRQRFVRVNEADAGDALQLVEPALADAALSLLSASARAQLHRETAQLLASFPNDEVEPHAAAIAEHFAAAGQTADAVQWHERAARWAHHRDRPLSLEQWTKALERAAPADAAPVSAAAAVRACIHLLKYGPALERVDLQRGSALHRCGRILAESLERPDLEARLLGAFALLAAHFDARKLGLDAASEAQRILPYIDNPRVYVGALNDVANAYFALGEIDIAQRVVGDALRSERPAAHAAAELKGLRFMHLHMLIQRGRLAEARSLLAATPSRPAPSLPGSPRSDRETLTLIDLDDEDIHLYEREASGYPDGVPARVHRYLAAADARRDLHHRMNARRNLALALLQSGDAAAAIAPLDEAIAIAEAHDTEVRELWLYRLWRARVLTALGEAQTARAILQRLRDSLPRPHDWNLHIATAEVLIACDPHGEGGAIDAALTAAQTIAERGGNPLRLALVNWHRALHARALGDLSTYVESLRQVRHTCSHIDAPGWVRRIEAELRAALISSGA